MKHFIKGINRTLLLLQIQIFLLLIAPTNFAQWTQTNGPYGGNIRSLAVSGTNLFAGTNGGVFL
jgi:hypothetical protein